MSIYLSIYRIVSYLGDKNGSLIERYNGDGDEDGDGDDIGCLYYDMEELEAALNEEQKQQKQSLLTGGEEGGGGGDSNASEEYTDEKVVDFASFSGIKILYRYSTVNI